MLDNGYEIVIDKNSRFVGNGHCSEIVRDNADNDWILYHGVDVNYPKGRVLLLDQIQWDDEKWPYIEKGTPSISRLKPVFSPE